MPISDNEYGPKLEQHAKEITNKKELPLDVALSVLFPGPPAKGYLHIMAWYPHQLKLSVHIVGGDPNQRTVVQVNSGNTVNDLLRAIKAKVDWEIDSNIVEAGEIKLWQVIIDPSVHNFLR